VSKRTPQLVLLAVLGTALLLPAGALAASQKGCTSAICVYREQQATPTGGHVLGQGTGTPAPLSSSASQALSQYHGADKSQLKALVKSPGYNIGSYPPANRVASGPTPRATGSFDLGTGGTLLFVLLAASGGLVVLGAGVRLWHARRSTS
jgi:hypothetical protein